MTLCEKCENRCLCKSPCAALEAMINRDCVGYGKRGVFVQNAEIPEVAQNDWLDWINIKEGVEYPEHRVDMEVFDNLSVPLPNHLKRTLILFFVEGMNMTSIAEQEDVTVNAIRKRISTAGNLIKINLEKRRYFYMNILPNRDILTDRQYYVGKAYYRDMRLMTNIANDLGTSVTNIHQHTMRIKALCR